MIKRIQIFKLVYSYNLLFKLKEIAAFGKNPMGRGHITYNVEAFAIFSKLDRGRTG